MRLEYWMYQGTAHHGVGRITNSMRNVQAVFHAPQGDDYVNSIFTMLERTAHFPSMTTSTVSGRDLAQGTIQLPDTLRAVEAQAHPELIVVCASCSTILLQEDLQRVANSAGTRAPVLIYDANPYRMQEATASEGLLTLLVKRFAKAQALSEQPSVNLIGPASLGFHARSDLIDLRRTMATLGVHINVVAPWGASPADLERLPAAWVNLAPYRELGQGAAAYLHDQFGTPAVTDAPIGVKSTLAWLNDVLAALNRVAIANGRPALAMPPLTAFSLDGLSAPSGVPWFARTADMDNFGSKRAFVFGDATHTVGVTKFLCDDLGMALAGVGTYMLDQADWVREQLAAYLPDGKLLVTDRFQEVAQEIEGALPDLVCGTQMERHSCRKLDVPCMVIAPPTHIENHLLSYRPIIGFAGADYLADTVYTSVKLGLEKHLIDLFGDAGLTQAQATEDEPLATQEQPIETNVVTPLNPTATHSAAPNTNVPLLVTWSPEAETTLKLVPFFVRKKARANIEKYARANGIALITNEVFRTAKEALGA